MSRHLRSAPGGLALVGRVRLVLTATVLWLAPGAVGAALFALADPGAGEGGYRLWQIASALGVSPLFSWAGWLMALPLTALALHVGWFGWLPAALIGAFAGWLIGLYAAADYAGAFGMVMLLALRAILGATAPAAFDPGS
ncbi:hypothetical protein [Neotabrizicola shimadae]|uniref:Uncharacterized protein n=1 Tax=Neotabrizicola shimadae TaxID=2807096 RepID=A0A8G0ZXX3_9RHOB|nr:hypothetical protein [Neotabrizicola shimadae]QYZ70785.1 hypothetical protein JO391_04520 [Neotabrizicola shimadae]